MQGSQAYTDLASNEAEGMVTASMSIFIDLETSGLSPTSGAVILSIGMITDGGGVDTPSDELAIHITPTEEQWKLANPQAMEVNGLTLEFLQQNGVPLGKAVDTVCEWLVNHCVCLHTTVVGQNPDFDYRFLSHFMHDQLLWMGFPIDRPAVNVIDLAKELTRKDKSFRLPNFKGTTISLGLGLEPEPAIHEAINGARAARRNYYELIQRLNNFR